MLHNQNEKDDIRHADLDDLDDFLLGGHTAKEHLRVLTRHITRVLSRLEQVEKSVIVLQDLNADRVKEIKEMLDERKNRQWLRKNIVLYFFGIPGFLAVLAALWSSFIKPVIDWIKAQ